MCCYYICTILRAKEQFFFDICKRADIKSSFFDKLSNPKYTFLPFLAPKFAYIKIIHYLCTQISKSVMTKESLYQSILPQIQSLVAGESDLIANMANVAAVLHEGFHFLWTGFYIVKDDDKSQINQELVLGPFQGPVACTRIPYNKGVCGTAWAESRTLIVPNVHEFPGYIACSSLSNSEIVVPIKKDGDIIAVLDIDSTEFNTFDSIDQHYLEQIVSLVAQ